MTAGPSPSPPGSPCDRQGAERGRGTGYDHAFPIPSAGLCRRKPSPPREDPPKFVFFHVCSSAAIRACARGPALGRRQEVSRWCETKLQNTPGSLQYCLRRWQTVFAPPGCAMQRNPLEDPAFLRGKGASWLSHGGRDSPLLRYGWYLVYPFFFSRAPVVWFGMHLSHANSIHSSTRLLETL